MHYALKSLLLFGLVLCGFRGFSQQPTNGPRPKQISYFDKAGNVLPSDSGADYRVETIYRDSVAGMTKFYYASGKLREVNPYAHVRRRVLHGPRTTWYETGKIHTKEEYLAGVRHGELLVYYPDGTVRRRDVFVRGKRTEGNCFGPDGQPVSYFEYLQPPMYAHGYDDQAALIRDLKRSGKYPERVLQVEMDAQIMVSFVVDVEGKLQNVKALDAKSGTVSHPAALEAFNLLRAEAEWMVRRLKPFAPARQDGEPIPYHCLVPITFVAR